MTGSNTGGWKKVALVGCGCLLASGLCVGVIVAMNWIRITGFVTETADVAADMFALQRTLQEQYPGTRFRVQSRSTSSVEGLTLSIDVVNSPFFSDLDMSSPTARAKAIEIAAAARDALPARRAFQRYSIQIKNEIGSAIKVSSGHSFTFEVGELPPQSPR